MKTRIARTIVGVTALIIVALGVPLAIVTQRFYESRATVELQRSAAEAVAELCVAVRAGGSVIKGLYFAHSREGPNDLVAFWLACSGILEPRPFLSFEFATGLYLLDSDRDGCADQTGVAPRGTIDPADFLESLPTRWWCPQIPAGEPV